MVLLLHHQTRQMGYDESSESVSRDPMGPRHYQTVASSL